MNENRSISEQELDKITGGIGGDGFEQAWAAYTGHCARANYTCDGAVCEAAKLSAAADWAAGQTVRCEGFIDPC